jgi:hypothetical protein
VPVHGEAQQQVAIVSLVNACNPRLLIAAAFKFQFPPLIPFLIFVRLPAFFIFSIIYFAWLTAMVRLRLDWFRMWQFIKNIKSPVSAKTKIVAPKSNSVNVNPLSDNFIASLPTWL